MGPILTNQAPYRGRRRNGLASRPWLAVLLVLLLAAGAAGALAGAAWYALCRSGLFWVTDVVVRGELRRLDEPAVQELAGITGQTSLFAFSAAAVRARIEAHPWVERARVERLWPDRVRITVRERRPLALVVRRGTLFYVDAQGLVFAPVEPGDQLDYPVISGIDGPGAGGRTGRPPLRQALDFLVLAGNGSHALPRQNISELRLTREGTWIMFLASRPFPIHLGTMDGVARLYRRVAKVLETLYKKKMFDDTAYLRLDFRPAGRRPVEVLAGMRS